MDARRCVYPVARRIGVTPPLFSGQLPSWGDHQVSSVPRVGAGVKVEVAAPFSIHNCAGMGEFCKHTAPLRDWSSAGSKSSPSSSSCGVNAGRLCGSQAVVSGSPGGFVGVEPVETLEGSSVKLELGAASDR
ncbi:unnamed protein product [Sphacelaria rigidula]